MKRLVARGSLVPQVICLIAAVLFVALGVRFRLNYYLIGTVVLAFAFVQFAISYEGKKPQARELVLIAVMCALVVASRIAFIWVPHFKPVSAMVMIGGLAFGSRAGFLIGAMSMLVSNFFFGQGPWTPWQMCAFGTAGFIMGALSDAKVLPTWDPTKKQLIAVAVLGFSILVLLEGPMLDTSTVLLTMSAFSTEGALAIYLAGLPVNVIHGASTLITLVLFANPLLKKLHRVKAKCGMVP